MTVRIPPGLGAKGSRLFRDLHGDGYKWNPAEEILVEEACRMADRLDRLNAMLTGDDDAWMNLRALTPDGAYIKVVVDDVLSEARQQANVLKQIVAALRLPDDVSGERAQHRGGGRGAYATGGKAAAKKAAGGVVSSLAAARAAREG